MKEGISMTFIKTPVKGMRDMTPKEMELREYVLSLMNETYQNFGFERIQTPVVEHIENLTNKQGGDNEKLIFKILKRGEKLSLEESKTVDDLVDAGLRYDLTVPLTRFYSNNMNNLPTPFRTFQTGNVYRADRPQKGRFREFMQCDLDMFGEKTNLAEIELITAVITFLKRLDFKGFTIHINDRRILLKMIEYVGWNQEEANSILISLDKLDKIGLEGVKEELLNNGYDPEKIDKYLSFFANRSSLLEFCSQFDMEDSIVQNLIEIMEMVKETTGAKLLFDPTLVRGMGYYTGPIFEIHVEDLESAIGGGGRYDKMVQNYTNVAVAACGFSIGFERLILLLEERGFQIPSPKAKHAIILNHDDQKMEALKEANKLRNDGKIVKVLNRSKNLKHQIDVLEESGYTWQEW